MHAADGDEEALRPEPCAVMGAHIGRNRRPQFRHAGLIGVEGLAAVDRRLGRLGDETGGRQVALPDPEGNQTLLVAAIVEHLDNAAGLDGADVGADEAAPVRFDRFLHNLLMNEPARAGKGSAMDERVADLRQ